MCFHSHWRTTYSTDVLSETKRIKYKKYTYSCACGVISKIKSKLDNKFNNKQMDKLWIKDTQNLLCDFHLDQLITQAPRSLQAHSSSFNLQQTLHWKYIAASSQLQATTMTLSKYW